MCVCVYPAELPKFNPNQSNSAARQTPKDTLFLKWRFLVRGQKAPKTHTKKNNSDDITRFPPERKKSKS